MSRRLTTVDADAASGIAQLMHALSTPSRVRLLYALRDRELLSVGELSEVGALTPAAASQQLRILRHLRLVVSRREGQTIRYRLHDDHVAALLDEIANHLEHIGLVNEAQRQTATRKPLAAK
jgi:DNA-binding transcriptional ArsR family regulator